MRRRGRKDVPAVEGVAERRQPEALVGKLVGGVSFRYGHIYRLTESLATDGRLILGALPDSVGQDPVVRGQETAIRRGQQNCQPRCPHARVHDSYVDGVLREEAVGRPKDISALEYVLRGYVVGDVNEGGGGVDPQNDCLHLGNVWVARAEVGGKGNQRQSASTNARAGAVRRDLRRSQWQSE